MIPNTVTFTIPGEPVPKARARTFMRNGRMISCTPDRTKKYEKAVAQFGAAAFRSPPHAGPVELAVHFWLGNRRRVDLDNLVKSIKDGLNGIAWQDDCQVVRFVAEKDVDPANPRACVSVSPAQPKP